MFYMLSLHGGVPIYILTFVVAAATICPFCFLVHSDACEVSPLALDAHVDDCSVMVVVLCWWCDGGSGMVVV